MVLSDVMLLSGVMLLNDDMLHSDVMLLSEVTLLSDVLLLSDVMLLNDVMFLSDVMLHSHVMLLCDVMFLSDVMLLCDVMLLSDVMFCVVMMLNSVMVLNDAQRAHRYFFMATRLIIFLSCFAAKNLSILLTDACVAQQGQRTHCFVSLRKSVLLRESGTVVRYVTIPLMLATNLNDFEVTVLLCLHGSSRNIVTTENCNRLNSTRPSTYWSELWVEGIRQLVQRRRSSLFRFFWCYPPDNDVFTLGKSRFD
jgi:hypothetical protein